MKTRVFRFFDTSPYNNYPVYWIHGGRISPAVSRAYGNSNWAGTNENVLSSEALVALPKFEYAWEVAFREIATQAKAAGNLIYLDMEHIPYLFDGKPDYRFGIRAAQILREICPGIKLTCYSMPVGDLVNNDWAIKFDRGQTSAAFNATFKASFAAYKPMNDLLDVLDLPTYLLGAACYDRDMTYFSALRRIYKRYYPHKPIICSAWGRYHDAWNKTPAEYIVAPSRLKAYADLLTRYGDDVIVFDEVSPRDDAWMSQLKKD